jgi:kynurenine formamidase
VSARREIVELAQPLGPGVLHSAAHAGFSYELFGLHKREPMEANQVPGSSAAADRICTGLHVGTHVDSLAHIAGEGRLCDGTEVFAEDVQSEATGIKMRSGRTMRPIVAPGILLDMPGYLGCDVLDDDRILSAEELLGCAAAVGVEIEAGAVVLIRTGYDRLWDEDPDRFVEPPFPGPGSEAARLLNERRVVATGSDTIPYEAYPSPAFMDVHIELLVRGGIFIMECLRLLDLVEREIYSFEFVALPLNLANATGSPISPVAIVAADAGTDRD